jgi:hypothetical protein
MIRILDQLHIFGRIGYSHVASMEYYVLESIVSLTSEETSLSQIEKQGLSYQSLLVHRLEGQRMKISNRFLNNLKKKMLLKRLKKSIKKR